MNCFQWFDEKQQEIETLDMQLKKLYSSIETLVGNRKGTLSTGYSAFGQRLNCLYDLFDTSAGK